MEAARRGLTPKLHRMNVTGMAVCRVNRQGRLILMEWLEIDGDAD